MDRHVLYKTVHGSHLYGLAHANSDSDYYIICANRPKKKARYAKQTIAGEEDATVMDFSSWLQSCEKGVPQALEAMFSNMALHDELVSYRAHYRVGPSAYETYLRTMKNFIMSGEFKRKRHALRLALNMHEFSRKGYFNPTLTERAVDFVTDIAHKDEDIVYAYCMNIALDRLPPAMVD